MIKKERKKVLILYNSIFHYRIPIFKILAEKCNLTVSFSIGSNLDIDEKLNFNILKLPIFKYKRFVIHKDNILKLCKEYDVVIVYGDIAWLKLSTLAFYKKRNFKVIVWTPGVSASYDKKFDTVNRWDSIRDFFYRRADALVFYTDYPIKKYIKRGFLTEKLFVAPNTVEVCNFQNLQEEKNSFLFIGTLYLQKGVLLLLENYKLANDICPDILPLNIIGNGPEFESVRKWIKENELERKIFLRGSIYNVEEKAYYFRCAYACISPFQAGLSVLESMGYGVPFITMSDAITGGERLNIQNGVNGILLEQKDQIKDILIDVTKNKGKYLKMGDNAMLYYKNGHKPEDMACGLFKAIEFVCSNKNEL